MVLTIKDFLELCKYGKKVNNIYISRELNLHDRIYRYLPIRYLLVMLNTKQLFVSNRQLFLDIHEHGKKETLNYQFSVFEPVGYNIHVNKSKIEQDIIKCDNAYRTCILCWTYDRHNGCDESILNWKCYRQNSNTSNDNICRIETTINDLLNSLDVKQNDVLFSNVINSLEWYDCNAYDRIFKSI